MEHMSVEEYNVLYKEIEANQKENKYSNEKVIIDGLEFDSQLEANRWYELKLLQRAKQIKDLRRQIRFELQPSYKKNGKTYSIN